MIEVVELSRRTWTAAVKLAIVLSVVAAVIAVVASSVGHVPEVAIVLPVIFVAFTASWVQTSRIRRQAEVLAPVSAEAIAAASNA